MAHPSDNRLCSPGIFRLVLFLEGLCLVGYTLRQQLFLHSNGNSTTRTSCPLCDCDCSSETTLPLPLGISNSTLTDDPEMNEEMKDIITLLTEEISLQ